MKLDLGVKESRVNTYTLATKPKDLSEGVQLYLASFNPNPRTSLAKKIVERVRERLFGASDSLKLIEKGTPALREV